MKLAFNVLARWLIPEEIVDCGTASESFSPVNKSYQLK
jgi:hypothetical protein